jgi:hypothetical protein
MSVALYRHGTIAFSKHKVAPDGAAARFNDDLMLSLAWGVFCQGALFKVASFSGAD